MTHRIALSIAALLAAPAVSLAANPPIVSANVTPSQVTASTYGYSMTLTDAASSTSPAGTFWFAWLPGKDFMTTSPLTINDPAGWTHAITGGNAGNGYAIQWIAGAGSAVPIGSTLGGFSFTSADPPSSVFGNSVYFPTTPVLTSVAYSGAPFSDAGTTFLVSPAAVPEPISIAAIAPAALLFFRRRETARR